jgi:hypothetical protein
MNEPAAALMRRDLALAHWTTSDLWVAALGVGGSFTQADIDGIVSGRRSATGKEYGILAAALHDHFVGAGPPPLRAVPDATE